MTEEQKQRRRALRKIREATPEGKAVRRAADARWRAANADKVAAQRARLDAARPGWKREWHLSRKFGITTAQYNAMLAEQGGGCAICGATEARGRYKTFHVDHDHATGDVRALLCNRCNSGIGMFNDDHRLVARAHAYLKAHRQQRLKAVA